MRDLKQEQWLRIAGVNVVLKEDKESAISGKQKDGVREETNAVSGTTVMSVQNRHRKPLHSSSHQHQEAEVGREKGVRLGRPVDSRAKSSWKVLALNYLVTIGILLNVNSISLNRAVNSAKESSFPHWKVEEQPNKKPNKGGDNSAVDLVNDVRKLGCVLPDMEPPRSSSISRKSTRRLGTNSTSTIHKSCAASSKHPRKQRSVAE